MEADHREERNLHYNLSNKWKWRMGILLGLKWANLWSYAKRDLINYIITNVKERKRNGKKKGKNTQQRQKNVRELKNLLGKSWIRQELLSSPERCEARSSTSKQVLPWNSAKDLKWLTQNQTFTGPDVTSF